MNAWDAYQPTAENPWDLRKVGHLYRRAGFGATMAELEAGVADGHERTLERFLAERPEPADFSLASDYLSSERSMPASAPRERLSAWWLDRMLRTAQPLREKMTLFWHSHFATSNAKVQNARYMLGKYHLMRKHALGSFRQLLDEMGRDPAMMVWLDINQSVRGNPNENYARELMELFSLGIGNYSESDIREAARAFTGYEIERGRSTFNASKHDGSEKKVLGRVGRFNGEDVARICLAHAACPHFIARKLYRFLIREYDEPSPEVIDPLADLYLASGFDTGRLVSVMLRSNLFFSPAAYRAKIKSPIEFAIGIVRGLEGAAGALPLAVALEGLGQILFAPPSVKGWDGGAAWLNSQTVLSRNNLALALVSTEDPRFGARCDPAVPLSRAGKHGDEDVVDVLARVFLQGDLVRESRARILEYMSRSRATKFPAYWGELDVENHRHRTVTHLLLTMTEFQLN